MSLNMLTLMGNAVRDPEVRHTKADKQVASFDVAVNERYGDSETTTYVKVVTFQEGLINKVVPLIGKGTQVFVSGKLRARNFERKDGSKGTSVELLLDQSGQLRLLSKAKEGQSQVHHDDVDEDDIPF